MSAAIRVRGTRVELGLLALVTLQWLFVAVQIANVTYYGTSSHPHMPVMLMAAVGLTFTTVYAVNGTRTFRECVAMDAEHEAQLQRLDWLHKRRAS